MSIKELIDGLNARHYTYHFTAGANTAGVVQLELVCEEAEGFDMPLIELNPDCTYKVYNPLDLDHVDLVQTALDVGAIKERGSYLLTAHELAEFVKKAKAS